MTTVVAYDSRPGSKKDEFYDPLPPTASYVRVVADVKDVASAVLAVLPPAGSAVAVTKHLCGGASDSSLLSLLSLPLSERIGAVLLAPCCHQKTRRGEYSNLPYLRSLGFCESHVGVRGRAQDSDWTAMLKLISMSKNTKKSNLESFEYSKSPILKLLGFARCRALGRMARRVLEEGRRRRLVEGGFGDARVVEYVNEGVTGDNLAIVGTKSRGAEICGECES